MIIKKIKLENIRSYLSQEFEFEEGSTLLAGDIGSGKSSILLAIDFVLFGLRKDSLTGASLLRNGTNLGSVELNFEIDGKDVVIKRNLKKGHDSISQDSGFITVNGEKRDATAVELKQDILNLLNYPKELLTKSKSLIYKYTVYTPQEEMKSILLGDKDVRLDTLRKVFDIDKYKRIKENSKLFITNLKQKRKEYEGQIYDLEEKYKQLNVKKENLEYFNTRIKEIIPQITQITHLIDNKREEIKLIESKIKIFEELKKDLGLFELKLKNFSERRERNLKDIESLILNINLLNEELKDSKEDNINEINLKLEELKKKLNDNDKSLEEINRKINELETKKQSSFDIKDKIFKLEHCPLCQQEVLHSHKSLINEEEDRKVSEYDKEIVLQKNKKFSLQDIIKDIKTELEKLREQKSNLDLLNFKKTNLKEKIERKDKLLKEQSEIVQEIISNEEKIKGINLRIIEFKEIDHDKLKKELDEILLKERKLEIDRATYLSNINELNKSINEIENEINNKLVIKNKISYLNDIQFWLEEYFFNVVDLIEKQIFSRVYNDFNSLFQKWFNLLMEVENFQVKLDEEFSPLILQNGHDMYYEYLSGGEKTAIALAYRLALNQVINNLITTIKTKDLLILDEPTDGFSDEQLDRVKNVLDELNIKQLIIVSHEQKVESFVDHIIRLNKEQHVTKVQQNLY